MISASIVTYNHHLTDFLPILQSLGQSPVSVVYIIDHSDKGFPLAEELKSADLGGLPYKYIVHENNGYGGGHNVALKEALALKSEFHLVVNPDVWFGPEVIPALVKYMQNNPEVGHIMPNILFPDGSVQRLAKLLPAPIDIIGRFCLPHRLIAKRNFQYELCQYGYTKTLNVPYLSGCFMFFRMSAVEKIGLFDERFFMYAEDIDFTRRMHREFKTIFYPEVTIYHVFSRGSHKSLRLFWIHLINIILYFNKWGWFSDKERQEINRRVLSQS